jgi:hypothetical protein
MSEATFLVAIKSTIDKLGNDLALAQTPPATFVDLDDITAVEEAMKSTNNCIIWEMNGLEEDPRDPLYLVPFSIGARTVNDAANYNILKLTGLVKSTFPVGASIDIKDYSGVTATASQGKLIIMSVSVNPQGFDRTSGVRLISIMARAQRWV